MLIRVVTTMGTDLISAKNITAAVRAKQVLGPASEVTMQAIFGSGGNVHTENVAGKDKKTVRNSSVCYGEGRRLG